MAHDLVVARPYAKAVFAIALAANKLSEWSAILNILANIAKDTQVQKLLTDPRIDWSQRVALFVDIGSEFLDQQAKIFLHILAKNRRLAMVPQIAEFYEELCVKQEKIAKAKIVSAMPLNKKQQAKLQAALEKRIKVKIVPQYTEDKSLIGGITIRIGDRVIDGSIRGQLEKLGKYLT